MIGFPSPVLSLSIIAMTSIAPSSCLCGCAQAVSCEAFCEALSAANPDHASLLLGLLPWYDTPGTPTLTISSSYSPSSESLTLTIKQNNHTAKKINKALHKPMLIPVKVREARRRADV